MFGILDNLRRDTRSVRILLSVTLGAALLSLAFSPVVWAQTEGSLPPVEDEDLTDENSTSNVPELLFVLDLSGSMEYWVSDGQKLGLAVAAIDDAYSALVEQGTHVEVLGYSGECTGWPPQSLVDMPQINEIDWGVESASLEASGATPTDLALVAALHRMGIVDSLLNPDRSRQRHDRAHL